MSNARDKPAFRFQLIATTPRLPRSKRQLGNAIVLEALLPALGEGLASLIVIEACEAGAWERDRPGNEDEAEGGALQRSLD